MKHTINKKLQLSVVEAGDTADKILTRDDEGNVREISREQISVPSIPIGILPYSVQKLNQAGNGLMDSSIIDDDDNWVVNINKPTEIDSGEDEVSGLKITQLQNNINNIVKSEDSISDLFADTDGIVYVAKGGGDIFVLDQFGYENKLCDAGFNLNNIMVNPINDKLYAKVQGWIRRIHKETGVVEHSWVYNYGNDVSLISDVFGNVYFVGYKTLKKIDINSEAISDLHVFPDEIISIFSSNDGNQIFIFCSNDGAYKLHKSDLNGNVTLLHSFSGGNPYHYGVDSYNNNYIYLNSTDDITKISDAGAVTILDTSPIAPFHKGAYVDKDTNDLIVSGYNTGICRVSSIDGSLIQTYKSIKSTTYDIVLDTSKNIYATYNGYTQNYPITEQINAIETIYFDGSIKEYDLNIKSGIVYKDKKLTKEYLDYRLGRVADGFPENMITKTKVEIDALILSNSLIIGTTYEITGVHSTLYDDGTNSGTTIYLQALTPNTLAKTGHGKFYNPKYDQNVGGFGIWDNRGTWDMSTPSNSILGNTGLEPNFMVFDVDGNLYTNNRVSGTVSKITPAGVSTILFAYADDVDGTPMGITIDVDGNIYTSNNQSNNVSKITPAGVSTILGTTGTNPIGIAIDSSGNIYTANSVSNNISKITPAGVSTIFGSTVSEPRGLYFDGAGNLYVTCSGSSSVMKIIPDGTTTQYGTTGSVPNNMVMDTFGNLYTVNLGSDNVSKIAPDGTSTILGTTGSSCVDIAIYNNDIYTTNLGASTISKITPDGASTVFLSMPPEALLWGIKIVDNHMYITDIAQNNVIKVSIPNFNLDEEIISNTGATGILVKNLNSNKFIATSGDWMTSTSITGVVTGSNVNISGVDVLQPMTGGKIIWGGYSWTNINGNVGNKTSMFVLNSEWTKDVYDEVNYKRVFDIIEYDHANDWISRRYEIESGNDVIFSKRDGEYMGIPISAISAFMFGNNFNNFLGKGIGNNLVFHSYNENINFVGHAQNNLKFNYNSYQSGMIYSDGVSQENITFGNFSYQQNIEFGLRVNQIAIEFNTQSYQQDINFGDDSYQESLVFGINSFQSNIIINENSYQTKINFGAFAMQNNITLGKNCKQLYLEFSQSCSQQNIVFERTSYQQNLKFDTGSVQNDITLKVGSCQKDIYFQFGVNHTGFEVPLGTSMANLIFEPNVVVDSIVYNPVGYVFMGFPKTVYNRPDGLVKLRYYNDSDVMVISNITD
jgi:hypothetical protein